jgi:tetratricopeptide (TPR) repeat protein
MKFNKRLLVAALLLGLVSACSSTPEQPAHKKTSASERDAATDSEKSAAPKVVVRSSALPPGSATPNPYLQNPQKLNDQVQVSFYDAVAAMQQKNWAAAEVALQALAEKNPKLSGVQLNLGIVYRNQGDSEKAAAAFTSAIAANLKNVDAYNQLAVLKREAGDFAAAESLYQKALGIWPFYPEGHKNLAILYDLYLGKPEQALPHYQAYQQLLPAADKQLDSWVADVQRRLNSAPASEKTEPK